MKAVTRLPITALCKAGFARTLLKATRGAPAILMYHGVSDQTRDGLTDCDGKHVDVALFRRQLEVLAESRKVVPLATLVNALRTGTGDGRMVAITFDDGFLNNVSCAAPALAEFGFTATIFLATGFIGATRWMWTDRLESALHRTARVEFRPEPRGETVSLANLLARRHVLHQLKSGLKKLSWLAAEESVVQVERVNAARYSVTRTVKTAITQSRSRSSAVGTSRRRCPPSKGQRAARNCSIFAAWQWTTQRLPGCSLQCWCKPDTNRP